MPGEGEKTVNTNSLRPASPSFGGSTCCGTPSPAPRPHGVQVSWLVCVVFQESRRSDIGREDWFPLRILSMPSQWVKRKKEPQRAPIMTRTGHLPRGMGGTLALTAALPGRPVADAAKGCFVQAQGPDISQHLAFSYFRICPARVVLFKREVILCSDTKMRGSLNRKNQRNVKRDLLSETIKN